MKISITELRDMVAETVGRVLAEAPRKGSKRPPKDIPQQTDEAQEQKMDRQVKSLPGYIHSEVNDFSRPLGAASLPKRQGASGMGNWTSESTTVGDIRRRIKEMQVRKIVRMVVGEEVRARRGR